MDDIISSRLGMAWDCLTTWNLALLIIAATIYKLAASRRNIFTQLGLLGPKPLPLIGNTLDFFKRPTAELDMENAKKYGKIYGIFNGKTPTMIVGDAGVVKEMLIKEFTSFVNRTSFKSLLVKPLDRMLTLICDDHWRHVRACVSPAYSSGKLKQMLPTISDCAQRLLAHLEKQDGAPVDVKDVLSGYTLDVISGTAFGLDPRSLEQPENVFFTRAKEFFTFVCNRSPKRIIAVAVAVMSQRLASVLSKFGLHIIHWESVEYMENVVKDALKNSDVNKEGKQSFAHLCLKEMVDINHVDPDSIRRTEEGTLWTTKGLILDDIVSNSIIFLLAGYETVSTFLSFFCFTMATNPDAQKKAYQDIVTNVPGGDVTYEKLKNLHYLNMCMDETLRLYPPVLRLDRQCNKAGKVGKLDVPEGMSVNIPVYVMHRDPEYWPDPEAFVPERFSPEGKATMQPCAYLPFGAGPRNCIGMRLALLEAKAAIVAIMLKYEICTCADTPKLPLKFGITARILTPAKTILLTFKKRQSSS